MFLTGFEPKDENGNQYPEIYSRAFNATTRAPFYRQVNQFLAPLRERGLHSVPMSAYLQSSVYPNSQLYPYVVEEVLKRLNERAKSPNDPNAYDIVFVWDIGDITMLTRNHIEELEVLRPDIDSTQVYNLRESICESVNDLEESISIIRNVENIEDALIGETDEMRRASPMYYDLQQLYNSANLNRKEERSIFSHDLLKKLGVLCQEHRLCQTVKKHQEVYNQRWKYGKKCIKLVNRRSAKSETKKYANVVVCQEGVASGVAQLLLAQLSSTISISDIYSPFLAPGESISEDYYRMRSVFERIQRRFGEKCLLIHVSSNPRYGDFPIAFWPIRANESFQLLYNFQRDLLK